MKVLKRLRPKVKIQKDFFVFDTETGHIKDGVIKYELNGRPESFLFGVVYGDNYVKVIYTVSDFIEEFKHPRYKDKKVFAHNAEYDLNVIFGNIYKLDPTAIFNGKFIAATNGNCQFADSLNIFKTSAKKIGQMLGLEKLELGNDLVSNLEHGKIPKKDIKYCIRDCEIIYKALLIIFEDSGDIKITQATLSLTYFRRFHQPFDIAHNQHTKEFWGSYYGGRVECFQMGKTHAHVVDANSSYPYAMVNAKFPNPKDLKKILNPPIRNFLSRILFQYEGLIKCKIKHKKIYFGYLPIKQDGKLIFPIGVFSGIWNFNELRFAIESKVVEILEIDFIVYSAPMESPFISYINELYNQRLISTNEFEKYRLKIFMNSLYGKFAQRIEEQSKYLDNIEKYLLEIFKSQSDKTFIRLVPFSAERMDAFLVTKIGKKFDASFAIPSFSSYITSFARVHLLKKMIELQNNKIVYCDTDSVFCEIIPINKGGSELGEWKLEDKFVTEIKGLKNYTYITDGEIKRKLKGVPEKAVEVEKNRYIYSNLIKTKEAMRRNLKPMTKINRVKVITGEYTKRIVINKRETKPIELC